MSVVDFSDEILVEGVSATLASSVYERLRTDILTGGLRPGEKLRAEFLRERYRVGNSPVREALNRLSADGLVVRRDQKGFYVATVSRADLAELIKTRCWLAEVALRAAIEAGGDAWEEGIVVAFHRLSKTPRSASAESYAFNPEWERLHRGFHKNLIAACGSQLLLGFCEQLDDHADRYRQLAIRASFPTRNELDEHRAIMDATIARRADEAVERLAAHYRRTGEIILESNYELPD